MYTWPQNPGAGCLSGGYLFNTRVPLFRRLDSALQAYESGELVINGDVNMRLYSPDNVPAGLPVPVNGMLVHVNVKKVGSLDYDTGWLGSLQSVASCP
jgi:hypothetical protein